MATFKKYVKRESCDYCGSMNKVAQHVIHRCDRCYEKEKIALLD